MRNRLAWGYMIGVSDMIIQLKLADRAHLDTARLSEIVARLGPRGAEDMISRAMEDLAVQLAKVHRAFARGNLHEVAFATKQVEVLAHRMGMPDVARVARDVVALSTRGDATAISATVARLGRIGESSLMEVWDVQDLSG